MRVLVFGASIVEGNFDTHGGWVARLIQDEFSKKQHNPEEDCHHFFNLGIDGDLSQDLINRFAGEVAARRSTPNSRVAIIISVGMNDTIQYHGEEPAVSVEHYRENIKHLYFSAKEITNHIMFVGLTPVEDEAFPDGRYRNERVWKYEEALRSVTKEYNVPFVPIYDIFRQNMSVGNKLFVDGLHPNDIGHEIIYLRVKQALPELFTPDKEEHWFDVIN